MKNQRQLIWESVFTICLILLSSQSALSQCSIYFSPSQNVTACPGDNITFTANGTYASTQYDIDFNSTAPAGWLFTGGASFGQLCDPSPDATDYYWSSTSATSSPSIASPPTDVSCGGVISFDFLFGLQGTPGSCDGPDTYLEGVDLQYSIDGGLTWVSLAYLNPTGSIDISSGAITNAPALTIGQTTMFTVWDNYSFIVPPAAMTPMTMFQWTQWNSSGQLNDNWGVDNIIISANDCGNSSVFDWSIGVTNNPSITVASTQDTSYIVYLYDTLGVLQCQDTCYLTMQQNAGFDNGIQLITSQFLPGSLTPVMVNAYNDGCSPTSGQITVILDTLTSFQYSTPSPDAVSGDTLFWNYSGLYYGSPNFTANIIVLTDTAATLTDIVDITAQIDPIIGDTDSTDNIQNYAYQVATSYDPNDKKVSPIGDCIPGFISNDQQLTYTIRFQNTGTAPATNVYLIDTLSSALDINTLKVVAASDPMTTAFLTSNTVRFDFDNIQLPDSLSDPLGSIGYVVFEIDQLLTNPVGTEITNNVDIYFDFNTPIRTNTVLNTISDSSTMYSFDTLSVTAQDSFVWNAITYTQSGMYQESYQNIFGCDSIVWLDLTIVTDTTSSLEELLSAQLSIYPNPSNGMFHIKGISEAVLVDVLNSLGQVVHSGRYTPSERMDVTHLGSGIYAVLISYKATTISKRIVLSN